MNHCDVPYITLALQCLTLALVALLLVRASKIGARLSAMDDFSAHARARTGSFLGNGGGGVFGDGGGE